jgi:hypothetical protein
MIMKACEISVRLQHRDLHRSELRKSQDGIIFRTSELISVQAFISTSLFFMNLDMIVQVQAYFAGSFHSQSQFLWSHYKHRQAQFL